MSVTQEVVSRCLALIPLIREHQGITLDELARLSRITKEQIAGELGAVLLMCGVPPYFPHDYIGFMLEEDRVQIHFADQFRRPVSLSPLEALALKLACESVAPPGKGVPRAIASLLSKVESAMAPEQRDQFRKLARRVTVRETSELPGGITGRIALAIAERRALSLSYVSAGAQEPKRRRVHPYGLLSRDGRWYLVGQDWIHERVVTFRLDRVHDLDVLDETFEFPADFELEPYARRPLIEDPPDGRHASIRFSGPSARWVRETAAPGTLEEEADGRVTWRHPLKDETALARFILGFGGEAEVVEPASLRLRICSILADVRLAHA